MGSLLIYFPKSQLYWFVNFKFPVLNQVAYRDYVWLCGGTAPRILSYDTWWRALFGSCSDRCRPVETLPIYIGRSQNRSPRFGEGGGGWKLLFPCQKSKADYIVVLPLILRSNDWASQDPSWNFIHLQHAALNYKTSCYEVENTEIVVACFKVLIIN
jgi:hypothetical protein